MVMEAILPVQQRVCCYMAGFTQRTSIVGTTYTVDPALAGVLAHTARLVSPTNMPMDGGMRPTPKSL